MEAEHIDTTYGEIIIDLRTTPYFTLYANTLQIKEETKNLITKLLELC